MVEAAAVRDRKRDVTKEEAGGGAAAFAERYGSVCFWGCHMFRARARGQLCEGSEGHGLAITNGWATGDAEVSPQRLRISGERPLSFCC